MSLNSKVTVSDIPCIQTEAAAMVDEATRNTLSAIPLMKTKAGPREKEAWVQRLKEEYKALIMYVENNKKSDTDWFR